MRDVQFFHQQELVESPFLKHPYRFTLGVRVPSVEALEAVERSIRTQNPLVLVLNVGYSLVLNSFDNFNRKVGREIATERMRKVALDLQYVMTTKTGNVYRFLGDGMDLTFKINHGCSVPLLTSGYLFCPTIKISPRHFINKLQKGESNENEQDNSEQDPI